MLSIVIPCYNEAVVIEKSVDKVIDFMKSIKVDYGYFCKNTYKKDITTKQVVERFRYYKKKVKEVFICFM